LEETFPAYQTALDNLPEEPTLVTLPTFKGRFFETDTETTEDPPANPTTTDPLVDPMHAPRPTKYGNFALIYIVHGEMGFGKWRLRGNEGMKV
jgi:hypothetical protein